MEDPTNDKPQTMGGLVLTRKEQEVVCIGDDIRVMVVEIRPEKVKLLIDAPRDVAVHREEVWLLLKEQQSNG